MSTELEDRLASLKLENAQLRAALVSRIVIEQAKGVLIERLDLPPEAVFNLLRSAARRGAHEHPRRGRGDPQVESHARPHRARDSAPQIAVT
jgi:hypothetical protein